MPKRLFIAVDPNQETQKKIIELISMIKRDYSFAGLRYTHPNNLHLTLRFLGDTDEKLIRNIQHSLDQICQLNDEFELNFSGLGVFPSRKNPRILWLGVANPAPVSSLASAISASISLKPESGNVRFTPHLTLGRFSENASVNSAETLARLFSNLGNVHIGTSPVQEILLYQSTLRPEGPIYNVLSRHPLKKVC